MSNPSTSPGERKRQLQLWVTARLGPALDAAQLQPLIVEASSRHFYRLQVPSGESLIAVDAPPETENNPRYLAIAEAWGRAGLAVPRVHHADLERGFLLIDDLGTENIDEHLRGATADSIYARAMRQLTEIQRLPADSDLYVRYDAAILERELTVFRQWICHRLLGISSGPLDRVSERLIDSALDQRQVCIHLDYHSRNLIWRPRGDFGLVDFQDARIGPWTYDVVSLLRDCYQRWDEQDVRRWSEQWCAMPANQPHVNSDFHREFDWCGIQRHLKAAGIFVRMQLRDGKAQHLPHVIPTLERVSVVGRQYADLGEFADWIEGAVLPCLREHLPCE